MKARLMVLHRATMMLVMMLLTTLLTSCVLNDHYPEAPESELTTKYDNIINQKSIDKDITDKDITEAEDNCGKTKGSFLDIWLDYYERGLSFMDCRKWKEAEDDLKAALSIRTFDKRRVYVRGMHAISDYFPNRELGITYYFQALDAKDPTVRGQYLADAEKRLQISMAQFYSEKAEIYLNKIRRINENKADKLAPQISALLDKSTRELTVTIKDDTYVEKVWLNGAPFYWHELVKIPDQEAYVFVEKAEKQAKFRVPEEILNQSSHLHIEASDIFGKRNSYEQWLGKRDERKPKLMIESATRNQFGQWTVKGHVSDTGSGLDSVILSKQKIQITDANIAHFEIVQIGSHFEVFAEDRAENKLTEKIALTKLGFSLSIDTMHLEPSQQSSVLLTGVVRSGEGLQKLLIGNKTIALDGKWRKFAHNVPLWEGDNKILVKLFDQSKRPPKAQEVFIRRTMPPDLQQSQRLRLALFPFRCNVKVGQPCVSTDKYHDDLKQQLWQSKRFRLANRSNIRQKMINIIECDDGVDEACAWLLNEHPDDSLRSEAMLVGETIERPLREQVTANTHRALIGIESSIKIINAKMGGKIIYFDSYQESKRDADIPEQLSSKVLHQFKLFATENIEVKGKTIEVQDSLHNMWERQPVNILKEGEQCTVGRVEEKSDDKATVKMKKRCKGKLKVVSS